MGVIEVEPVACLLVEGAGRVVAARKTAIVVRHCYQVVGQGHRFALRVSVRQHVWLEVEALYREVYLLLELVLEVDVVRLEALQTKD